MTRFTVRRSVWGIGVVAIIVAALLTVVSPAYAGTVWDATNLTARTSAPAPFTFGYSDSASYAFAFSTDMPGEGPAARIVYIAADFSLIQLKSVGTGPWRWTRLTAPGVLAAVPPHAYVSNLAGQGPTIRILFLETNRNGYGYITELSAEGKSAVGTESWTRTDLTAATMAPHAYSRPFGFETHLPGVPQAVNVVYIDLEHRVQQLTFYSGMWHITELDVGDGPGVPYADGDPYAFVTNLPVQGPRLRILFSRGDHLIELSSPNFIWTATDLTVAASAPPTRWGAYGIVYDDIVHVVYRTTSGATAEILTDGIVWKPSPIGPADGINVPFPFTTNLPGEGPKARIVYSDTDGQIVEYRLGADRVWRRANLTSLSGGPAATLGPCAYTTDIPGEGPRARVVYFSADSVIELRGGLSR